ncbi:MAG: App1 family protein [Oligoflexia bacterium]|nr:App1 family protein [Oligoflexia bacterium]
MRVLFLGLVLSLALSASAGENRLRIVSDVDDTVKVTHVGHASSLVRGTIHLHAFAGMATLYRELEPSGLDFVSGSPRFLRGQLRRFLGRQGFPDFDLHTRDYLARPGIDEYKAAKLEGIFSADPESDFILVGDDTELDPLVYERLSERYPGRVSAIYIRQVKGLALPEGQESFFTAFDVALMEWRAGRLSAQAALRVGEAVLDDAAAEDETLLPGFASCPPEAWLRALLASRSEPAIEELALRIEGAVGELCEARLTSTSPAFVEAAPTP